MQKRSIDTTYDGYKFRSRLEARWSIFFNQLGIRYSFEPEGFSLEERNYLPDFLLQDSLALKKGGKTQGLNNIWVEIKPSMNISNEEKLKISQFVKEMNYKVLLISGDPDPDSTMRLVETDNQGKQIATNVTWAELDKGLVGLISIEDFLKENNIEVKKLKQVVLENKILNRAYMTAKQARFEFGDEKEHFDPYGKKCANCGQEFVPREPNHKFCYQCYSDVLSGRPLRKPENNIVKNYSQRRKRIIIGLLVAASVLIIGLIAYEIFNSIPVDGLVESPVEGYVECSCISNIYDCEDFSTHEEAQECFDKCYADYGDIHYLDANDDLEACELLP